MRTRPATKNALALACDAGGTRIKLGIVRNAKVLAQIEIDPEAKKGLAAALKLIAKEIPALCRKAGVDQKSLCGFGLSFPGIIEPRTEKILSTPSGKFDDAKHLDVLKLVEKFLGLPAHVCNDANAALAGEWHYGPRIFENSGASQAQMHVFQNIIGLINVVFNVLSM